MDETKLADLLDTLGQNSNFKLFPYYAVCFNAIPSAIKLSLPQEGSKELLNSILQNLELEKFSFKPIFKNWHTENTKNAMISDNYVYEYVFKSESRRMLIHLIARSEERRVGKECRL